MGRDEIVVLDGGRRLKFRLADLLLYHGSNSPGGVAHAFKVLERVLPALDPEGQCERRDVHVRTAFGGPGARDGFEMVLRAVTGGRYTVDAALERPELGRARERFVFELAYRGRTATAVLRDGFVSDEFIELARAEGRTAEQEARLDALKAAMTRELDAAAAADVYDLLG